VINEGEKLLFLDMEGKIKKNLKLKSKINDIIFLNDEEFIGISEEGLSFNRIPEYIHEKTILLNVYNEKESCNNIDVYVKSNDAQEKFMFVEEETGTPIAPYYLATYKNNTIVKILGSKAKSIIMRIDSPQGNKIEGIVVNADKVFLK
jgi:IMP cyclohydrolase